MCILFARAYRIALSALTNSPTPSPPTPWLWRLTHTAWHALASHAGWSMSHAALIGACSRTLASVAKIFILLAPSMVDTLSLHYVCTSIRTCIVWEGIRAVVTATLGFDSCAVCCAFVFPNAGCNKAPKNGYAGCCGHSHFSLHTGHDPEDQWPTCVLPSCNRLQKTDYYGGICFC